MMWYKYYTCTYVCTSFIMSCHDVMSWCHYCTWHHSSSSPGTIKVERVAHPAARMAVRSFEVFAIQHRSVTLQKSKAWVAWIAFFGYRAKLSPVSRISDEMKMMRRTFRPIKLHDFNLLFTMYILYICIIFKQIVKTFRTIPTSCMENV